MRFKPTSCNARAARRRRGGFTLAEVLAALLLMAIVIPVAVQALQVASRAGEVGQRKAAAARIAERVLEELVVERRWQQASQNGTIQEGSQEYRWLMRLEPWSEGDLSVLTVQVTYPVQGQEYDVRLSTLVDPTIQ